MVRYVYIDVLLVISLIVNYLLIVLTAHYLQLHVSQLRSLTVAGAGALYATGYIVGGWTPLYGVLGQLVVAAFMLKVLLPASRWRIRLKAAFTFVMLCWLVAGAAFGVHFMQRGDLSDVRWWVPLIAVGVAGMPARLAWQSLLAQRWEERNCIRLTVVVGDEAADLVALLDTGNQLSDPLTGLPVMVVEQAALQQVLRGSFNWQQTDLEALAETEYFQNRLHVIPYCSLGNENGLLVGFRPDRVVVHMPQGRHICQQLVVAVYQNSLSTSGRYQAIAPPELMRVA